jgi:hypothetical protein
MSFLTGTNVELLYANTTPGTAKNTFTSEAQINDTAGMGAQASIPQFFFYSSPTTNGRAIHIEAAGILSTTGSPTFTWTIRLGAQGNTTTALVLGTAAVTAGASVTNSPWRLSGDIVCQSPAGTAGANTTVRGIGMLWGPSLASPFSAGVFGGAATPGTVSIDTSITNYINFNAACGTSSASNSITVQQLMIYGCN